MDSVGSLPFEIDSMGLVSKGQRLITYVDIIYPYYYLCSLTRPKYAARSSPGICFDVRWLYPNR